MGTTIVGGDALPGWRDIPGYLGALPGPEGPRLDEVEFWFTNHHLMGAGGAFTCWAVSDDASGISGAWLGYFSSGTSGWAIFWRLVTESYRALEHYRRQAAFS